MARDEHLRFVDPRYAKLANSSEGDDLSTVGSFDAEPDALSLHAELGGLVKHALHAAQAHLPTLVEGERFAADQESGMTRSIGKQFYFEKKMLFRGVVQVFHLFLFNDISFFSLL